MNTKKAFTLVELLVVVTIIGILSSLLTVGVSSAVRAAKQARIKMTMGQVELALEQYKAKYGEYPPDWSDQKAVLRHIKKRWPRINLKSNSAYPATVPGQYSATWNELAGNSEVEEYRNFCSRLHKVAGWETCSVSSGSPPPYLGNGNGHIPVDFAFAGTLAFWLGGLPDNAVGPNYGDGNGGGIGDGNNKTFTYLIGFSTNPEDPFDVGRPGSRKSLEKPVMEFEVGKNLAILCRNPNTNGTGSNCSPLVWSDTGPVAYFKATKENDYRVPQMLDFYCNVTLPGDANSFTNRYKSLWNNNSYNGAGLAYRFSQRDTGSWEYFYPGVACPYLQISSNDHYGGEGWGATDTVNNKYYNPKTYQLVHPGLDGKFGAWQPGATGQPYGSTPIGGLGRSAVLAGNFAGAGVGQFDLDNIVNFGDGATIKSMLP